MVSLVFDKYSRIIPDSLFLLVKPRIAHIGGLVFNLCIIAENNVLNSLFSTIYNCWGFAPDPTYFLCCFTPILIFKSVQRARQKTARLKPESKQRNSRLRPPHSKNYALWAKKSELAPPSGRCCKQQIFLNAHFAFGELAKSARLLVFRFTGQCPSKNESYLV